jgi:hypothetical protein
LDERGEGSIDLAFGAGLHDVEFHPLWAGCFLRISDQKVGDRIVRVDEQSDSAGPGTSSQIISISLGARPAAMLLKPVMLPPGRARPSTRPTPTGLLTEVKTIGIVEVAFSPPLPQGCRRSSRSRLPCR